MGRWYLQVEDAGCQSLNILVAHQRAGLLLNMYIHVRARAGVRVPTM